MGLQVVSFRFLEAAQDEASFEQTLGGFESGLFGVRLLPRSLLGEHGGQWQCSTSKVRDVLTQPSGDAEKSLEDHRSVHGGLKDGLDVLWFGLVVNGHGDMTVL
jgi:hypothetical protein